ncbi:MAG: ABC transporter ATP-binding protein, partial [Candidatus Omnitrophica bacterium]|nr:ABC transporter ATP-binding protein [Candidatus Omnitrophota bacterium]
LGKSEIKSRLDSIIDFSELRDFIYCPLRDFSIGMQGRLAFSIAKEMDSQVLILDEVLEAGDTHFMEKCSEALQEHEKSNKTIIIISHNIDMIESLCDKILLLNKGRQVAFGPAKEVMDIYRRHKF